MTSCDYCHLYIFFREISTQFFRPPKLILNKGWYDAIWVLERDLWCKKNHGSESKRLQVTQDWNSEARTALASGPLWEDGPVMHKEGKINNIQQCGEWSRESRLVLLQLNWRQWPLDNCPSRALPCLWSIWSDLSSLPIFYLCILLGLSPFLSHKTPFHFSINPCFFWSQPCFFSTHLSASPLHISSHLWSPLSDCSGETRPWCTSRQRQKKANSPKATGENEHLCLFWLHEFQFPLL